MVAKFEDLQSQKKEYPALSTLEEEYRIQESELIELRRQNQLSEEESKLLNTLKERFDEINNEISKYSEEHKEDQKYIDTLNEDITNLKISVSSFEESNLSIDEILERINSEIEAKNQNIQNNEKEITILKNKNEALKSLIIELNQNIQKIENDVKTSSEKQENLKESRTKYNKRISELEKAIEKQFGIIKDIKEQILKIGMRETNVNDTVTSLINELWTEYEITPNNAKEYEKPINIKQVEENVKILKEEIKLLGIININSIEEYKKTEERYTQMNEQRYDLETTISKLHEIISEMTETMKRRFKEKFEIINQNFNEIFKELFGGGMAKLSLEDENNILECGIDIQVQPTGKKLQNMMLLSGGERALTAIVLLFAILKINPSPFCILDEIEAALDDVNVYRYAEYLKKLNKLTQFLIITHRKGSMEAARTVYGVTMEENGISKLLSITLK